MDLFSSKVMKYSPRLQKDVGIKGFQADGVFGNLGEETKGFTQLHQVGGNGLGWAQWDDRRPHFELYARTKNLSVEDDEANYGFLVQELLTTELHALEALKATRTRDDATRVFMQSFERPGVPALDVRIRWAERAEKARLQQEATMVDAPGTAVVPTTTVDSSTANVLADWIIQHEVPVETALRGVAVAKGVPGFAVDLAFQLVNPLINQLLQNTHPEDIAKILLPHLLGGVQSLVNHLQQKAA